MIRRLLWVGLLALPIVSNADQGQQLHDSACIQCHTSLTGGKPSSLYTREARMVNSKIGLVKQVSNCSVAAGVTWNNEQKTAVVNYLSKQFYHF
jgi:mono/diheme cytochrome c family protein